MQTNELIPHLFRTEFRKIVAVLSKLFGIKHIEIAEDIASETFLLASETWGLKGLPQNPTAWLYTVSKNKARDFLRRQSTFENKVAISLSHNYCESYEIDLSNKNISDNQLQMIFVICNTSISEKSQIGLALKILCGFGIEEIAEAFLTNKEVINKRLYRAREKLRASKIKIELPSEIEIEKRLETVLKIIYLVFNEGYYSSSANIQLRKDFCLEAIRLNYLLTEYELTNKPIVNALLSLMCFHASRFEARINKNGDFVLYDDQDTRLWNQELILKGEYYLSEASKGDEITKYHLEAAIAFWHTQKKSEKEKWNHILQLYNHLLQLEYSPIAALNRTYALSKVKGKKIALEEAKKLQLINNHLYFSLLGELYKGLENNKSKVNFKRALKLAKTEVDKKIIENKIKEIILDK